MGATLGEVAGAHASALQLQAQKDNVLSTSGVALANVSLRVLHADLYRQIDLLVDAADGAYEVLLDLNVSLGAVTASSRPEALVDGLGALRDDWLAAIPEFESAKCDWWRGTYARLLAPFDDGLRGGARMLAASTIALALLLCVLVPALISCQIVFGGVGMQKGAKAFDEARLPYLHGGADAKVDLCGAGAAGATASFAQYPSGNSNGSFAQYPSQDFNTPPASMSGCSSPAPKKTIHL